MGTSVAVQSMAVQKSNDMAVEQIEFRMVGAQGVVGAHDWIPAM